MAETPTWSHWREIPAVCLYPPNLVSTLVVAAVVGTVLFGINQLDVVLSDGFSPRVWLKAGLTLVVPFCVSNYGLIVGTRRSS